MTHTLFITPSVQSMLFAEIFSQLLSTSFRILPQGSIPSKRGDIFLEEYSWEHLLIEYERKFGELTWFHHFQPLEEALEHSFHHTLGTHGYDVVSTLIQPLIAKILSGIEIRQHDIFTLQINAKTTPSPTYQNILRNMIQRLSFSSL